MHYQTVKKLTFPSFDLSKMSRNNFALKLHAALIECEMSCLKEQPNPVSNA
jgi:hypothetical protein